MSGIRLSRHFLPAMREKNWNMNRPVKSVWVVLIAPHAGLVSGSSTQ